VSTGNRSLYQVNRPFLVDQIVKSGHYLNRLINNNTY
jgi:hypothetical protein